MGRDAATASRIKQCTLGDACLLQAVNNEAVLQGPTNTEDIYQARLDRQLDACMKTGKVLTGVEKLLGLILQAFPSLTCRGA